MCNEVVVFFLIGKLRTKCPSEHSKFKCQEVRMLKNIKTILAATRNAKERRKNDICISQIERDRMAHG